ncbi:hypothetical protein [Prosthecobacter sp.]|uniref:hypothetical protein n=1 Tax=Prosthecobacter sp. TaxID=1965333 RepID=UPI002ABD10BF|nr:hypothetical protein [Prosthecobacter sp.]MDZ4405001.1 hypothetical protein [Prosthecobacter sp.]
MKTITSSSGGNPVGVMFALGLCALVLSGCTENETQVLELRQLREKLAAVEKRAAAAAQQPARPSATGIPQELVDSAQKLVMAEARIALLEKELQEARDAPLGAERVSVVNVRDFVEAMKNDLAKKVGELCRSVELAVPAETIKVIELTSLPPLEKIVGAYESKITFQVVSSGQTRHFVFRVQPGLDGQWHLPEVAVVKQQIMDFIKWSGDQNFSAGQHNMHKPSPLPLPPQDTPPKQKEKAHGSIIIRWAAEAVMPQPQGVDIAGKATIPPAKPPEAKSLPQDVARPGVPKLIMPVQQDVQVRFEQK